MITTKELTTIEDFENLQKGDVLACEFKRDTPYKKQRFVVLPIYENKVHTTEIILDRKTNTYFNYRMFVAGESSLKSAVLIRNQ